MGFDRDESRVIKAWNLFVGIVIFVVVLGATYGWVMLIKDSLTTENQSGVQRVESADYVTVTPSNYKLYAVSWPGEEPGIWIEKYVLATSGEQATRVYSGFEAVDWHRVDIEILQIQEDTK